MTETGPDRPMARHGRATLVKLASAPTAVAAPSPRFCPALPFFFFFVFFFFLLRAFSFGWGCAFFAGPPLVGGVGGGFFFSVVWPAEQRKQKGE